MFDIPIGARHIVIEENETSPHIIGECFFSSYLPALFQMVQVSCRYVIAGLFYLTWRPDQHLYSSNQKFTRNSQKTQQALAPLLHVLTHLWEFVFTPVKHLSQCSQNWKQATIFPPLWTLCWTLKSVVWHFLATEAQISVNARAHEQMCLSDQNKFKTRLMCVSI